MTAFKRTAITTEYFQRTPLTTESVLSAFALDKDLLEGSCILALSIAECADYKENQSAYVWTQAHVISAANYFSGRYCGINGYVPTDDQLADILSGKILLV
jgi:hypothetical protein